jgi:hypothetical protein
VAAVSHEGRLSARKLRWITSITGIEAVAGWAWSPNYEFRDAEDNHYLINIRTGEWEAFNRLHYSSCAAITAGEPWTWT